jgi:hypothetical protein
MHQEFDFEVLERPLRLLDLETKCGTKGKEVIHSFKSGHTQLLPFRDRSGRRVFTTTRVKGKSFDAETRVSFIFGFSTPCRLVNSFAYNFCCTSVSVQDLSISLACCL